MVDCLLEVISKEMIEIDIYSPNSEQVSNFQNEKSLADRADSWIDT